MKRSISVILPTFNGQKYIAEAIDSALAQTIAPHEIIVVDDGSTDGTEQIVRSYGSKVRYIYQNNKGTTGAYNTGIEAATGDYIAFLEHDDVWLPDKNAIQVRFLDARDDIGMVFSPVLLLEDGIPSKQHGINLEDGEGEYTFADFFVRNRVLNCSTVMIRRSVFQGAGDFREDLTLSFDYDLWLRISATSKIACLSAPLVQYRIHDNNLSRDSHDFMAAEGSLKAVLFWADNPLTHKLVGANMVKKRVGMLHREMSWYCAQLDRRDDELLHLWAAVTQQPFRLDGWREYLWRRLDRRTRNRLTWYARKLFGQPKDLATRK